MLTVAWREGLNNLMPAKKGGSGEIISRFLVQWSDDIQQGPGRKGSNKAGPRLYEPQGKRFSLLHGASATSRVFE